jgi:hypothetical protein
MTVRADIAIVAAAVMVPLEQLQAPVAARYLVMYLAAEPSELSPEGSAVAYWDDTSTNRTPVTAAAADLGYMPGPCPLAGGGHS